MMQCTRNLWLNMLTNFSAPSICTFYIEVSQIMSSNDLKIKIQIFISSVHEANGRS